MNLTVNLTGSPNWFSSITINNVTYTGSDFTNNSMTIQVPSNTDLSYTVSCRSGRGADPESGTLNLSEDYTLSISISDGKV